MLRRVQHDACLQTSSAFTSRSAVVEKYPARRSTSASGLGECWDLELALESPGSSTRGSCDPRLMRAPEGGVRFPVDQRANHRAELGQRLDFARDVTTPDSVRWRLAREIGCGGKAAGRAPGGAGGGRDRDRALPSR